MKNLIATFTLVTAVAALCSCEKTLVIDDEESPSGLDEGTARLSVVTRVDNSGIDISTVTQGRIYVFNSAGKCVQLLSTDDSSTPATTLLPEGAYTLYAVGGPDLERFNLPTKSEATPTSVITLKSDKVMDDLLIKRANITLKEGESLNQTIALEHKVLCINDIEIKNVPADVTAVEVTLAPLYSTIRLDGTYPDSPSQSYDFSLTKQADGTTWKAQPKQMLLPSIGEPTIKIAYTTPDGIKGFSYTANEELPANHHFTIVGTYTESQGVSFSGLLTTAGWEEDRTVTFNFNDDNQTLVSPVAQTFYNGYYVVTVNEQQRKAVLLSKGKVLYDAPDNGTAASLWLTAFEQPMANLEKPAGATADWRLPTLDEVSIFTKDSQIVNFTNGGNSPTYYCTNGTTLMWAYTNLSGSTYTLNTGTATYGSILLRPVIELSY